MAPFAVSAAPTEVNLYTTREPALVQPLLDAYTANTGIKVNTVFLKDGLAERVASEGARSPADVLMAVDFGNLTDLVDKGVTQSVKSKVLEAAVPAQLRDSDGNWFALSMRARTLYAAKDLKDLKNFTYEELADAKWKGKVCVRSGQHPYNTALIAHMIAKHGEAYTETWLRGVKANLARKAGGGDREVARDILGGLCDVGIANSYYVGLMRSGAGGADQKQWGDGIQVLLPTFKDGGTHVNVSGAAIAKHAPNRDNAVKLLEFLVSDEAQGIYAKANFEYPVKAGATVDPIIAALGTLTVDSVSVSEISKHRKAASLLVDKVGFDN
ncbi:extracellular solute-binding protein [Cellvibrio sp. KB43]|uniref:Extracellular solute-binding protein n=2 Tax=Cellvibrio polysaccharolyticus TaxID=2082724 RepID=A0A928YTK5_9GAMM|nr:extracellular solute-binding protein [Cellvibrio polysaccharolyticus]